MLILLHFAGTRLEVLQPFGVIGSWPQTALLCRVERW